jgi:PAS domain S-box-containing protein
MTTPVPLADLFTPEDLFASLEVSLTGINLLRPVYGSDGSTITDFAIAYLNPAGQRMTGLAEQPGGTLLGRFPHSLAEGIFQYYRRVFETGEQLTYHTNYQADGLDNFFQFSARRSGAHLVVSFTDTSDQDRSAVELVLRESQAAAQAARAEAERERALLQALLTQAPVAIGLFQGEDVRVTAANSLMAAIWGYTPEQVVGRPLVEGVPELRGQGFDDLLREVLRTQVPVSGTETPAVMRRNGELKTTYYNFVYQPLYNAAGEVLGVIDVAVDVTEQVLARQQLEQLNQELETRVQARTQELTEANAQLTRTNVELDTFVYTASHDLKAPITNIESITLALRDTLPAAVQQDEMIAHLLDLLEHTTTRFQATISQLTDLTKLQLAHAGPAESVNLAAVVESVRLDLVPVLTQANAHLTVEVTPDLLVSFSPANLRSSIYNLLSNAVKYRALDRPAQVRLRAFPAGSRVVLEVQDNGLGMSEVQQRQLFGLFQRLHTHVEGTGVGLYITKRLVENGGGTIAVQSHVAVGTTFTLTFPA